MKKFVDIEITVIEFDYDDVIAQSVGGGSTPIEVPDLPVDDS